jgi:hypothetical protein
VVMIFFMGVFLLDYADDSRPSCITIMSIGHETTLKERLKRLHWFESPPRLLNKLFIYSHMKNYPFDKSHDVPYSGAV